MDTPHETARAVNIRSDAPDAYRALAALTRGAPDIDHALAEVVKVRVSQINGCAYCVDLHSGLARAAGVPERTLYAIAVWRESTFFTEDERAALDLAEALTLLHAGPALDDALERAAEHFPGTLLAQLVIVVSTIGVWNRVMLVARTEPAPLEP
jgi:AhpD family alkylhydroperoxidase